jgi:hypothetical protein
MYDRIVYACLGCTGFASAASYVGPATSQGHLLEVAGLVAPAVFVSLLYWIEALLPKRHMRHTEAEVGAVVLHVAAAVLTLSTAVAPLFGIGTIDDNSPQQLAHAKIALYSAVLAMSVVRVAIFWRKHRR